ncbi:TPA: TnsA endonuclease N-terminal domain-containing protein [Klebsiella pneumoniae]
MARARSLSTFSDFQRALKNGYGLGACGNYKPWLRVQDVPSRGTSAKIQGIKTSRAHHFLSEGETCCFFQAEFLDRVVDVREQFPLLPISLCRNIADVIGIRYPKIPTTRTPVVMTTDFLLTCQTGNDTWYEAISVKPDDSFSNMRVAEKLDLERIWWELLGVSFTVFVPSVQSKIQSKNIEWATSPLRQGVDFSKIWMNNAVSHISIGTGLLSEICDLFSSRMNITSADASLLFRNLIALKYIKVDLNNSIPDSGLVKILQVNYLQPDGEVANEY